MKIASSPRPRSWPSRCLPRAFAHARVSPPVAPQGRSAALHARRADREGERDHDEDRADACPQGFGIDSFAPSPGWKRKVQQTGSGEDAVIQKVTWSGGSVPTGEDSVFSVPRERRRRRRRTRSACARRTRTGRSSTGTAPSRPTAPPRRSRPSSSLGGGSSSTLAIVAIVVGAVGCRCSARIALLVGRTAHARVRCGARRRARRRRGARRSRRRRLRTRRCYARSRRRAAPSNTPPKELQLTFSEAVEPRFAIVSVTDAAAHQETTGPPRRSPANPDTLLVPLKHLREGWYLVYWRAISVDGHPVRGAFTFAVGPNPGPAPQFVIPSISETAATPQLLDRPLARRS